jgi:hypothetical protein
MHNFEQWPGKPAFDAAVSDLSTRLSAQDDRWLQLHLMDALWLRGEPATDENLHEYLPRLSGRRYPDGTIILALDALPESEHRQGTRGRVLFGFGEGKLSSPPLQVGSEPAPYAFTWERPLMDARACEVYEARYSLQYQMSPEQRLELEPQERLQQPGEPDRLQRARQEVSQLWPRVMSQMLHDFDDVRARQPLRKVQVHRPQMPPQDLNQQP